MKSPNIYFSVFSFLSIFLLSSTVLLLVKIKLKMTMIFFFLS